MYLMYQNKNAKDNHNAHNVSSIVKLYYQPIYI